MDALRFTLPSTIYCGPENRWLPQGQYDPRRTDVLRQTWAHIRAQHESIASWRLPVEVMNILWGCLIAAVGLFLFVSATRRSEFVVYRLLVARSRILWGDKAHAFHQISGVLVIIFGLLVAFGVIK